MTLDKATIGNRIKERRIHLSLSQEDLAEKLSISQGSLSRYENGERSVALEDLPRLAKTLYVDVSYFISEDSKVNHLERQVIYEPILEELQAAAHDNEPFTPDEAEEVAAYIKMKRDLKAKRRGVD
jgi:transcriptional regulator with XRE-family HTH domain